VNDRLQAQQKVIAYVQHEGIVTRDAERSKDFYMKLLDLQVLENKQANGTFQLLCNDSDGHTLEFQRLST
jgi:hypothetical protein